MTTRISSIIAVLTLLLVAAVLIWRNPTPQTPEERAASWGQGFQWGEGKFGDRR